jgi:parallel beta-helix repeat protein
VLAALGMISLGTVGQAASLFVSTAGNDAWPGTAAQPWRTLQHAAENVAAGDIVTVRPGNYAGFHLTADGSPGNPITFFAEPGVLIDVANPVRVDQEIGINLENASHVVIDGFEVTGMDRAGVRAVGVNGTTFASRVTIRNVHSHHNGYWGILTGFVNDLLIENNETSHSTIEHGIYVSNSGDRPIIRNNHSWANDRNGIHINGDADVGGDGIIANALISGNVIHGNGVDGGSGINMDGVQNSRIENNLLYDNHASGISLYRINGGGPSSGNVVVNNTVVQADDGRWALNIQNASTGNTVLNNILLHGGPRGAIDISSNSLDGFSSDYNVVTNRFTTTGGNSNLTFAQWRSATGEDANSIIATPAQLFANPSSDFHLLATAPAINDGTSMLAPAVDIEGQTRPIGAAVDIGAYEWSGSRIAGDFNGDSAVNAADYVAWTKLFGSAGGYQQWRQNFGQSESGGGASAAPEPPSIWMCLILVAVARYGLLFRR